MKDQRIRFIRRTLDSVVDSLEASVRLNRWAGAEPAPEPLKRAAARLIEHLGTADRLSTTVFRGTPQDAKRVESMIGALKQLDTAYVAFRKSLERSPAEIEIATGVLTQEIDEVKHNNDDWAAP